MDGVVLAFDFGLKKIGVAIGNTLLKKASPLTVIHEERNDARFLAIEQLIFEWNPLQFVVGLPFHADGTEHALTKRCRRFANQLTGRFHLPAVLVDERFSSIVVSVKPGQDDDDIAASLILQQYFDQLDSLNHRKS